MTFFPDVEETGAMSYLSTLHKYTTSEDSWISIAVKSKFKDLKSFGEELQTIDYIKHNP